VSLPGRKEPAGGSNAIATVDRSGCVVTTAQDAAPAKPSFTNREDSLPPSANRLPAAAGAHWLNRFPNHGDAGATAPAAAERFEERMMSECQVGPVTPAMETAIRREVMRCAMLGGLAREAAFEPRSIAEADAAIVVIEAKAAAVRSAIRLRDPSLALAPVAAAAAALGLAIDPAALPRVGRAVLGVLAELHDAELHVESGATVEEATRELRDVHFGGRPPERLPPPVRLATAVEKAIERAPTRGMTDKVKTTGELMLAFFGADAFLDDVFTKKRMIAFLAWCMRLPRGHGTAGTNTRRSARRSASTKRSPRPMPTMPRRGPRWRRAMTSPTARNWC
jgi:hypothetical protein